MRIVTDKAKDPGVSGDDTGKMISVLLPSGRFYSSTSARIRGFRTSGVICFICFFMFILP